MEALYSFEKLFRDIIYCLGVKPFPAQIKEIENILSIQRHDHHVLVILRIHILQALSNVALLWIRILMNILKNFHLILQFHFGNRLFRSFESVKLLGHPMQDFVYVSKRTLSYFFNYLVFLTYCLSLNHSREFF